MIDALIKRVSVTYKCYEMYAHRGKKIDQEMDAILLIIGIAYVVFLSCSDVNTHGFRGKHMHFALLIIPIFLSFSVFNRGNN